MQNQTYVKITKVCLTPIFFLLPEHSRFKQELNNLYVNLPHSSQSSSFSMRAIPSVPFGITRQNTKPLPSPAMQNPSWSLWFLVCLSTSSSISNHHIGRKKIKKKIQRIKAPRRKEISKTEKERLPREIPRDYCLGRAPSLCGSSFVLATVWVKRWDECGMEFRLGWDLLEDGERKGLYGSLIRCMQMQTKHYINYLHGLQGRSYISYSWRPKH